jgi:hypothetical protein
VDGCSHLILRYYPDICLEELRKTMEIHHDVDAVVRIGTGHFHYHLDQVAQSVVKGNG